MFSALFGIGEVREESEEGAAGTAQLEVGSGVELGVEILEFWIGQFGWAE